MSMANHHILLFHYMTALPWPRTFQVDTKKKLIATNADLFFDICWLDSQSSMGGTTLL